MSFLTLIKVLSVKPSCLIEWHLKMPVSMTSAETTALLGNFQAAANGAYTSSRIASEYDVTSASVAVTDRVIATQSNIDINEGVSDRALESSSSSSLTNLKVAVRAGIGGAILWIAGLAFFKAVRGHRQAFVVHPSGCQRGRAPLRTM